MNYNQVIEKMKLGYQVYHSIFKQEYSVSNNGVDRTVIDKETFDLVTQDPRVLLKGKNMFLFNEKLPNMPKIQHEVSDKEIDMFIDYFKQHHPSVDDLEAWGSNNPGLIDRLNNRFLQQLTNQ